MNANQAKMALNYIAVNAALVKKALDELTIHRQAQEKAASLRPDLLKHMIDTGTVGESQKTAADAMLGSHAETLGLLKSAVDKIDALKSKVEKHAGDLGRPADDEDSSLGTKSADDYDSLKDPYVGRKTSEKKASDEAILRVLDAPSG